MILSAIAGVLWSGTARRPRREAEVQAAIDRAFRRQEQGRIDGAIAGFREAVRLDPDSAEARLCLGIALVKRDPAGATAELRAAIRLRPDSGMAHLHLGHALINQGKADEAIPEYREAIRLDPENPWPRAALAFETLMASGPGRDHDEALRHARRACELDPTCGNFASILAWAEYRTGHWAEAIAAAERTMPMQDGFMQVHVWFILAMSHWQRGERDEATGWFDLAIAQAEKQRSGDASVRRLWAEAAVLLDRPGPDADAAGSG